MFSFLYNFLASNQEHLHNAEVEGVLQNSIVLLIDNQWVLIQKLMDWNPPAERRESRTNLRNVWNSMWRIQGEAWLQRQGLIRAKKEHKQEAGSGNLDRFEAETLAFHERLRQGFRELTQQAPERIAILNALKTSQDVLEAALMIWNQRF